VLKGALAAAVTPLRDEGDALDEAAFGPYVAYLAAGGLDGILALGTTGEGILLTADERRRAAALFIEAASDGFDVAVHCGAQTTAETVALAAHAAEIGADAVAVIGPPYYALDEEALVRHFTAAAEACAPLPFYLYEFRARAGYSIPPGAIDRLRELAPNLAGLKVSNQPFEQVEPYLVEALDVFVGAESLVLQGLERGAAGAVSGLAAAFPELVARLVHERSGDVGEVRAALERFPFQAALKIVLAHRGVPVRDDVRAPLRGVTEAERRELETWLEATVVP
jgi:dihydrodipicolinate synthase/N-acetylneuraminate lyase